MSQGRGVPDGCAYGSIGHVEGDIKTSDELNKHKTTVKSKQRSYLPLALAALVVVAAAMAGIACSPPREDPFALGHRGSPTPTPQPDETPVETLVNEYDLLTSGETIKIAEWEDNRVKLLNFLAGYVIVFGFDHPVEIVSVDQGDYGPALLNGDVHLVIQMEQDWYESTGRSAGVLNIGAPFENLANSRIGANPGLQDIAPGIVEFLSSFVPGDERTDELASRITGGRFGMRPSVAAIKYFKENEEVWTQWVGGDIALLVKDAVKGNKTALINRKCIPDGGNANCVR